MRKRIDVRLALRGSFGAALLSACVVQAQVPYPSKPVHLIVGYGAGGGSDSIARMMAQRLTEEFGRQVVVENRPGAGGNLGTEAVVRATADGHTLLMGNIGPIAVNPNLGKLPYEPTTDLAAITMIASTPLAVLVHPSLNTPTLKAFVALAKRESGNMNYSSAGAGTSHHLTGELFKIVTGVNLLHVPYRSAAEAVTSLVSGQVHMSPVAVPSAVGFVRAKRVQALAVTASKRVAALPDTPTAAEAGYKGIEVSTWYGLFAPAATPKPILDQIYAASARAIASPEAIRQLANFGADPSGMPPAEFSAFVKAERERWGTVVRKAGIKSE